MTNRPRLHIPPLSCPNLFQFINHFFNNKSLLTFGEPIFLVDISFSRLSSINYVSVVLSFGLFNRIRTDKIKLILFYSLYNSISMSTYTILLITIYFRRGLLYTCLQAVQYTTIYFKFISIIRYYYLCSAVWFFDHLVFFHLLFIYT